MTAEPTQITRLKDVPGLLAMVPALVGFTPQRSLVALFLDERRVRLTMRADLDDARLGELADTVLLAAQRAGADEVVLIGYLPNVSTVIQQVLLDLAIAVENATMDSTTPLFVRHLLAVGRDGWIELDDWSEALPPLRPLAEIEDHPVRAQSVYQGRVVAASREDLAARVRPGTDPLPEGFGRGYTEQMEAMASTPGPELREALAVILDEYCQSGQMPGGHDIGRLVALVTSKEVRDVATLAVDSGDERWIELWSAISRCTRGSAAVMPLALAALAHWLRGDGAVANVCIDLADEITRGHPLVGILRQASSACLPPSAWEACAAEIRAQQGLDDDAAQAS